MHAAILQATAEMRAAPRPLPSSDWMKVISQRGARSLTILWNLSRKLKQSGKYTVRSSDSILNPSATHSYFHGMRRWGDKLGLLDLDERRGDPPWVQLVNGAVDAHCDHQGVLAASLPHLVDDGSEARAAHVGRAGRDALADQTHDVAVQLWRQNAQRGEDVVDLLPVPAVTGGRRWGYHWLTAHITVWHYDVLHAAQVHNVKCFSVLCFS